MRRATKTETRRVTSSLKSHLIRRLLSQSGFEFEHCLI